MPRYSPGMGVRGFPLIFHSLIPLVAGSVNVVTGQKSFSQAGFTKKNSSCKICLAENYSTRCYGSLRSLWCWGKETAESSGK